MFCSSCGSQVEESAKFCVSCGGSVAGVDSGMRHSGKRSATGSQGSPMKIRRFSCSEERSTPIIDALERWLSEQNFLVQRLRTEDERILLQVARKGGWRKAIGMSTALNVVIAHDVNALTVEIGQGRWVDKAIVGTVSLFVLWPLMVTAGFGAWQQMRMPSKIFDFIEMQCK